jgi:hypothetical protein
MNLGFFPKSTVLTYGGEITNVNNLQIGDYLINDNNNRQQIINIEVNTNCETYKIYPLNDYKYENEAFIIGSDNVVLLYRHDVFAYIKANELFNDYSDYYLVYHKVEYPKVNIDNDPYLIGCIIGGMYEDISNIYESKITNNINQVEIENVFNYKYIPPNYLYNESDIRKKILDGIIDASNKKKHKRAKSQNIKSQTTKPKSKYLSTPSTPKPLRQIHNTNDEANSPISKKLNLQRSKSMINNKLKKLKSRTGRSKTPKTTTVRNDKSNKSKSPKTARTAKTKSRTGRSKTPKTTAKNDKSNKSRSPTKARTTRSPTKSPTKARTTRSPTKARTTRSPTKTSKLKIDTKEIKGFKQLTINSPIHTNHTQIYHKINIKDYITLAQIKFLCRSLGYNYYVDENNIFYLSCDVYTLSKFHMEKGENSDLINIHTNGNNRFLLSSCIIINSSKY